MSDPIEIIADAMNDSRDYGIPAAKYVATKLEAAGYRLLSAEGVTEEMRLALHGEAMKRSAVPCGNVSSFDCQQFISAAILAAPLFGKGSEK